MCLYESMNRGIGGSGGIVNKYIKFEAHDKSYHIKENSMGINLKARKFVVQ